MRKMYWIAVVACLLTLPSVVLAADAQFFDDECVRLRISDKILGESELGRVNTDLVALYLGELSYRQSAGYCLPTADRYVIGLLWGTYPRILTKIEGHHLSARIHHFAGDPVLLIFYSSGGNLDAVQPYGIAEDDLFLIPGITHGTNLDRDNIKIVEDSIVVTGRTYDLPPELATETYRYVDGSFELVDEVREKLPFGPESVHEEVRPDAVKEPRLNQSESNDSE